MFQPISHVQIEVWGLLTGGRALAKWHAHWRTPQHCHLYMCLCMIAVRSQHDTPFLMEWHTPKKMESVETLEILVSLNSGFFCWPSEQPSGSSLSVRSAAIRRKRRNSSAKSRQKRKPWSVAWSSTWTDWTGWWFGFFSFSSIVGMMIQSD